MPCHAPGSWHHAVGNCGCGAFRPARAIHDWPDDRARRGPAPAVANARCQGEIIPIARNSDRSGDRASSSRGGLGRRGDPEATAQTHVTLDCFASLAMTERRSKLMALGIILSSLAELRQGFGTEYYSRNANRRGDSTPICAPICPKSGSWNHSKRWQPLPQRRSREGGNPW